MFKKILGFVVFLLIFMVATITARIVTKFVLGGRKEKTPEQSRYEAIPTSNRDIQRVLSDIDEPIIRLLPAETGRSYFGGEPPKYDGFVWPTNGDLPLNFLARLDLSELPNHGAEWLPRTGTLLFFYDNEDQLEGYSPDDKSTWKVIYVAEGTTFNGTVPLPEGLDKEFCLAQMYVVPEQSYSLPAEDHPKIASLKLTSIEKPVWAEYRKRMTSRSPAHWIGGFPDPIQNFDMEIECELAANGIDSSEIEETDPRVAPLQEPAKRWRLLLQMDSDEKINAGFGDEGRLYFWIREEDAKNRNFDNVRVILQGH